jgi:SAM-dependent methyltransferase
VRLPAIARRLGARVVRLVCHEVGTPPDGSDANDTAFEPGSSPPAIQRTRRVVAAAYLRGEGIEIGALHQPLELPPTAHVKYVDRMPVSDLRRQYPELSSEPLVPVDIIDDGEQLASVAPASQDFVIANHFLEHCENPILTVRNLFRVLKPDGILYLAVPDKRYTFDAGRPSTTVEHVVRDYSEGPQWSRSAHFTEWTLLVNKRTGEEARREAERLLAINYSIHFHVWTATDLFEFVLVLRQLINFELELFLRNGFETVLILRQAPSVSATVTS